MWKKLNFANRTKEALVGSPSPPPEDEFKARPYEIPTLEFHAPATILPGAVKHVKQPSEEKYEGVSPPDSPRGSGEYGDEGGVSPVDEHPDELRFSKAASSRYSRGSYIPVPRKPSGGTRWDAFSGEPTTGQAGRAAQFTPGNPYYIPSDNGSALPRSLAAEQAQKRGIIGGASKAKPREPWKGASGRSALVEPVRDSPQPQKTYVPQGSPNPPTAGSSPMHATDSPRGAPRRFDDYADRQAHEDTLAALTARRQSEYGDKEDPTSRFSWTTYATSHHTSHSRDVSDPPSPPPPLPTEMPAFFSTTMPMPQQQTPKLESILDRKRPVPKDDVPETPTVSTPPRIKSTVTTMRKPVGMNNSSGLGISNAHAVKPPTGTPADASSILSSSTSVDPRTKGLPPAPAILASAKEGPVDHVALLRSQMDDLSLRRANVQRAINNLTAAQARIQNPMLTDWRSAREAEKRVQALRDELAEINREDHDMGLKLHRAYKRREKEGDVAGTSALWVRRVTS